MSRLAMVLVGTATVQSPLSPDRDLKSSVQAASRFLPQRAPLWDLPPLLPLTHCSPRVSTQRLACPFVFLHPGGDRLSLLLMHGFPRILLHLDTIHTLRGEGLRTLESHIFAQQYS